MAHDAGDGPGLGDFLGFEAVALKHIQEVGVSAYVQLHGAFQLDAAILEQLRQHTVHNGRAEEGLDIVADDLGAGVFEPAAPVVLAGDKYGDAIHHGHPGLEDLFHVPFGGLFAAYGQVIDDHVGSRVFQDADDVDGAARSLLHDIREVVPYAIVGHAPMNPDAKLGNVGELDGVVGAREDRLGHVQADFSGVDVERGRDLHVLDVVAGQVNVHQSGHGVVGVSPAVILDTLNQR